MIKSNKKGKLVISVILGEIKKVQNGSVTVIIQDGYPIQVNTYSKYF